MSPRFACASCGCPSVRLPSELKADALVSCRDCGKPLATWREFKSHATRIIIAENPGTRASLVKASYDPLAQEV
jgi:uncharacterized Zn finger protein